MSTPCTIAIKLDEDKFKFVYVHFDGYPQGVGAVLQEHYQTAEKVAALVEQGDIAVLGKEIGEKHDFDDYGRFENGVADHCTFYGRDREEEGRTVKPRPTFSLQTLLACARSDGTSYLYLFADGQWLFTGVGRLVTPSHLRPLAEGIEQAVKPL